MSLLSTQFTTVNGLKTRYAVAGNGEDLLLVHGFPENLQTWNEIAPLLANHYRIWAPDLKGSGNTEADTGDYSQKGMADFLAAFMDEVGVQTAYVVGHDIGLGIELALALHHPERVKKFIGGSGSIYPQSNVSWILKMLLKKPWGDITTNYFLPAAFRISYAIGINKQYKMPVEVYNAIFQTANTASYKIYGLKTIRDYYNYKKVLAADIGKITTPALIFWGEADPFVPVWEAEQLVRDLPNAQLNIIKGGKHFTTHEDTQQFVKLVTTFLQN